ncbi:hypothetical protein MMC07_004197 [Pseudocyphellaria aurata]|nr:hypothetical protein [Pseudocyphellaria aurata]
MGRCAGQVRGDSDIASVGVVSAIFVNAVITFLTSALLWTYIYVYLRKDQLDLSRQPPKWVQIVKSVLVVQGDSQLIGALAIIITSLIRFKTTVEIPLYHTFIARSLVDIALTGHAAAIVHVYPTQHHWGLRLVVFATTMLLWQWWGLLVLQNFRTSNQRGDHCFEDSNGLLVDNTTWIWMSLFWTPVAFIVLYLNLWEGGRSLTDRLEEVIVTGPRYLRRTVSLRFRTLINSFADPDSTDALRNFVISIGFAMVILISWTFALILPASRVLNPVQLLISFIWDAYDVWVLREANARVVYEHPEKPPSSPFLAVDDPEDHWGFGQTLPFVMMLFPILSALDAFNGKYFHGLSISPRLLLTKNKYLVIYNQPMYSQIATAGFPVTGLATGQDLEASHGQRRAGF